ncbi:MAG: Fe(3+) ABC transporter substrate-binding protein [Rhodospirillales bacterium]|nr:Fe(3+) ABC transporter substrate-binding protein [Rhodospirillales bacterium]
MQKTWKSAFTVMFGVMLALPHLTQAAENEVNLYSERQPFLIDPLLDVFTKETGIRVNLVYLKKGLFERLRLEGRNTPADAVLTNDIGILHNLAKADLLQVVTSPVLERNILPNLRHPDGLWYGLSLRARVIYAHKDRVEPGEVTTYEDLAKPEMAGRVCSRSGKHIYNVSLLASIIAADGRDAALNWARGLKRSLARRPQGNDRAQVKAVFEGLCDFSLGNTYYMGKMATNEKEPEQKQWANSVNIIFPNQQGRGTHVNISGAGVTKHAKNKDNAVKLIEYLSGDSAQTQYALGNFEYPVRADIALHPLVASWGKFKADTVSLSVVAEKRVEASKIMDEVGFDQ